jgi:hypothetical protein
MNRYLLIRRLYGPAFLLLVGVNALLNEAGILSWGRSWPLYLILAGVLKLAERAALASEESYGDPLSYPGPPVPYPGQPAPAPSAAPSATAESTAIVATPTYELTKHEDGGRQ